MRLTPLLAAAALVLAAGTEPGRRAAAGTASALLEAAPFALLAGLPALRRALPWLGCGCGAAASLSLPAAAVTAFAFGPAVGVARLAAGIIAVRFRNAACRAESPSLLEVCSSLLLPAALASVAGEWLGRGAPAMPPWLQVGAGAAAGLLAAPCALGAVVFAGSIRAALPEAAIAIALTAGLGRLAGSHRAGSGDGIAAAAAALACFAAAARGGAGLVRPEIAVALWPVAAAFAVTAWRRRRECSGRLRFTGAAMLLGTVLSAPPPAYHATETTLGGAFPGERVTFSGVLTRTGTTVTLVRYAIVCCRADAAPVVLRLQSAPPSLQGWVRAAGVLVAQHGTLALKPLSLARIAPPSDPFVYR